jgi:SAM-dependent methyltransferase
MALPHHEPSKMFQQQLENSRKYVVPFVEGKTGSVSGKKVLEIGSAEGGVLSAFAEKGADCLGVELHDNRTVRGREYSKEFITRYKMELTTGNIFDTELQRRLKNSFDIIILKDVIEHLPDQASFVKEMKTFLKPGGVIFFGFPPWHMPFGGHQQITKSKIGKLPYYHILPRGIYRFILSKIFNESDLTVTELLEIHDTQISINRFLRIMENGGYKIIRSQFYLVNPIYQYKFGLKPRKQFALLQAVPYLRDFFTTCCYYLVGRNEDNTITPNKA